jgi:hypothetical protein
MSSRDCIGNDEATVVVLENAEKKAIPHSARALVRMTRSFSEDEKDKIRTAAYAHLAKLKADVEDFLLELDAKPDRPMTGTLAAIHDLDHPKRQQNA